MTASPHGHGDKCNWKLYGVRRKGDADGLFSLEYNTCGPAAARDLTRLRVGQTYRFVLGASVETGSRRMLDAVSIEGPFPPCSKTKRSLDLQELEQAQVEARFGSPDRQDSYPVEEKRGVEFYGAIERAYPSSVPENGNVQIRELLWRADDCALTVWLHRRQGTWVVVGDAYYAWSS